MNRVITARLPSSLSALIGSLPSAPCDGSTVELDLSFKTCAITACAGIGAISAVLSKGYVIDVASFDYTQFAAARPHKVWRPLQTTASCSTAADIAALDDMGEDPENDCGCCEWSWEDTLWALLETCSTGSVGTLSLLDCFVLSPAQPSAGPHGVSGASLCGRLGGLPCCPVTRALRLTFVCHSDSAVELRSVATTTVARLDAMFRCLSDGKVRIDPQPNTSSIEHSSQENAIVADSRKHLTLRALGERTVNRMVVCYPPAPSLRCKPVTSGTLAQQQPLTAAAEASKNPSEGKKTRGRKKRRSVATATAPKVPDAPSKVPARQEIATAARNCLSTLHVSHAIVRRLVSTRN